ncbi:PilC/PilY family type IV pilus protein [Ottowia sp.]|uniref:pilus assembly protein n=1 Tax=Ottowia sp. TaxID=1898956 RepID=UPI002CEEF3DF|nr:PilC/PilY family type IV pilus protein [Ottowia sp.]HOB66817.1 PilC/PilY family type IV pilus protein [Ottowia sp.]HPZ55822.1 PilC/PilY family type IV pilus protein [Ottowia sp.]HQD48014.1 PilC/PilY family type IV pilus protein [Ottowia sp.]
MPRRRGTPPRYSKTLLALAAGATLVPHGAWALDLSQSPPGTVEPYVAPNVIVSVDDSGSMGSSISGGRVDASIVTPNADGSWDTRAPRMNILRFSLNQVFNDRTLLPEKKIRLAWQTLWNQGGAPSANSVDSAAMNQNSMRPLQGTHRANFLAFVNSLVPSFNTPLHMMFTQADAYMRRAVGVNSPWASDPGNTGAPYLACRRNYHIVMTDGRWNGAVNGGEQDGAGNAALPRILPDGTIYADGSAAQNAKVALYRDTTPNTVADLAFRSWADPLQPAGSLTGTVQPTADYRHAPSIELFGNDSVGRPAVLERYWNPRYDPATWPHMVTYTIGFSNDATTWPGAPNIIAPTAKVPFGYDGSFRDLVTGNKLWPNMINGGEPVRALDLWHAALNGRGRFYAVMKGEDLEKAFREIVGSINSQTDPDLTASATSGSNTSRNDVGKYTAGYEPANNWKGLVKAEKVQKDGSTVSDPGWAGKTTADKLDDAGFSVANRVVLSWSDQMDADGADKGGVPFRWASDQSNLSATQKLLLQTNTSGVDEGDTMGQNRLNFLRGDRGMEGSDTTGYTAAKPFRERKSRQGDIVNSVVWYTGAPVSNYAWSGYAAFTRANRSRPAMIYVGGNDGMLHGFAAADGTEKLAYVPRGVISSLNQLSAPEYNNRHQYFVDGSPMTGDIDQGAGVQDPNDPSYVSTYVPDWRTLLVGTLGNGGKGYFVLDVTNPTGATSATGIAGFEDSSAASLVKLDRTRGARDPAPDCVTGLSTTQQAACNRAKAEDADIGSITGQPVLDDHNTMRTTQITRMNNNRWAVVMGNGYNSKNQRPVLLIQYLDGDKSLRRIPVTTDLPGTGDANDNGLASPQLVDLNGDGRPDVVYAGDNRGNLWKFDLTHMDDNQWQVAFGGTANVATPDDGVRGSPAGAKPLFTARGPASLGSSSRPKIQPITAAPTVRANDRSMTVGTGANQKTVPVGGMMVAFGTGRNVALHDAESVDVQTLYSVLDNTRYRVVNSTLGKRLEVHPGQACAPAAPNCVSVPAPAALGVGVGNANLAEQKVTELNNGDYGTVDTVTALSTSNWANYNGWYMDLPAVGERLLKPMQFYDGSNLLAVYSQAPAKGSNVDPDVESCDSTSVDAERQFRTLINIMDGKRPSVQIVDYNGDGNYALGTDLGVSRAQVTKGSHTLITQGKRVLDIDVKNQKTLLARMPEQSLRPSWRQLQ